MLQQVKTYSRFCLEILHSSGCQISSNSSSRQISQVAVDVDIQQRFTQQISPCLPVSSNSPTSQSRLLLTTAVQCTAVSRNLLILLLCCCYGCCFCCCCCLCCRLLLWEARPVIPPSKVYDQLPQELMHKYQYFNTPATAGKS